MGEHARLDPVDTAQAPGGHGDSSDEHLLETVLWLELAAELVAEPGERGCILVREHGIPREHPVSDRILG